MVEITDKSQCSGCGACRDACPTMAIRLVADDEGFLYPQIDAEKCIGCGKCDKACPIKNHELKPHERKGIAYAAQTKDEAIRQNSSSGGVFTEIATHILQHGGVVFGAAFDENFKVIHIAIDDIEQLHRLQGSKYVQSEIGNAYVQAKAYLDAGRLVLFTGTPCQIGGLYGYLRKDYDTLYTQDIICHGVPSPMVWQKYIEYREAKAVAKLQKAFFRNKKSGWKRYSLKFEFTNSTDYIQSPTEDLYMRSFISNLCLRPSCYHCAFKSVHRQSDVTLADFWGIENILPEIDDDKGTSLVIVNSDKGMQLFQAIQPNIKCCDTDIDEAIKYNSAMTKSVPQNNQREAFIGVVAEKGFYGVKRFLKIPFIRKIKNIIKSILKRS